MEETYTSRNERPASQFTGTPAGVFLTALCVVLFTLITLGIGTPWALCMACEWFAKNTYINGKRLEFTGSGGELLWQYIKWIVIGVGIFVAASLLIGLMGRSDIAAVLALALILGFIYYAYWLITEMIKWLVSKINFVD